MSTHVGKTAIVKSLLDAMAGETSIDATVILSSTREVNRGLEPADRIPVLVLGGRSLEALSLCHAALRAADCKSRVGSLKPLISDLRNILERELLSPSDIDLVSQSRRTHLLPRRSILIGRHSPDKRVDVAVNCRWFSRGDRNLALFFDASQWFVEDLGSTNGHSIGGQALKAGTPASLPVGETRIDVGYSDKGSPLATIRLFRPPKDPGAVVVAVEGKSTADDAQCWPSIGEDMSRRWVVFREQIGVSSTKDCALTVEGQEAGILAAVRYQSGFWIVPSSQKTVEVDDIAFRESVPLFPGASLHLCGTRLRVEQQIPLMERVLSSVQSG